MSSEYIYKHDGDEGATLTVYISGEPEPVAWIYEKSDGWEIIYRAGWSSSFYRLTGLISDLEKP